MKDRNQDGTNNASFKLMRDGDIEHSCSNSADDSDSDQTKFEFEHLSATPWATPSSDTFPVRVDFIEFDTSDTVDGPNAWLGHWS